MSVYKPLFFNNSSGLSLIFWEPSVFLPPLSPNNLIFNNIDFRYRFALRRHLYFFSITFPGSAFFVLQQGAEERDGTPPTFPRRQSEFDHKPGLPGLPVRQRDPSPQLPSPSSLSPGRGKRGEGVKV